MMSTFAAKSPSTVMLPFMEPIHVLGSGSIGLFLAASIRIAFPSYPITMLLRGHHRPRLQQASPSKTYIQVSLIQKNRPRVVNIPARIIPDMAKDYKIRSLLLTTKAPDAASALESLAENLDPQETQILLLCNGALAVRDEILALRRPLIIEENVQLLSTTHGVHRHEFLDDMDDLFSITHAGSEGKMMLEKSTDNTSLQQLFHQAGLNVLPQDNMERHLWFKLAANCVINPLTTICQCRNGDLASQTLHQEWATRIIKEVESVAPPNMVSFTELEIFVQQVIQDSHGNVSSMWQDIQQGRKTEIDYLNGFIVQKGRLVNQSNDCDVSANEYMWNEIRKLEQQQRDNEKRD